MEKSVDTPLVASRPVRVVVPAKVYFDLSAMQEVTERVLGQLNCPTCHSGFDIRFEMDRVFRFDEKLKLQRNLVEIQR